MGSQKIINATCPNCSTFVEGTVEEFSRPLQCPGCGSMAQFRHAINDEEMLAKGAVTAAKGVAKAGIFAGGLLRRTISFGADKYLAHKKRSQTVQALRERLLAHLQTERPSVATLAELRAQSQAAGVELLDVAKALEPTALRSFCAREISFLASDGQASDGVDQVLEQYVHALGASDEVRTHVAQGLARFRQIREIRNGRSKPLTNVAGLVVRNSEIVWYQADASSIVQDRANGGVQHLGRLFVTNLRMTFVSRTVPDELQYGDINAVELEKGRVFVTGKSNRSCAEFIVAEPEVMAEHVRYAVRLFHRQVDVGFESNGSQHISQEVKLAVWQRDGGKCVQCRAVDYLEYDHIIPVAKGGANTIQNVQLLCRRCNSKKSDKI